MNYDWRQYIDNYAEDTEETDGLTPEEKEALRSRNRSRANEIGTMSSEELSQSQVEGTTPISDKQVQEYMYIPGTISGGLKAGLPYLVGALGASGLAYSANEAGLFQGGGMPTTGDLREAAALAVGKTITDYYSNFYQDTKQSAESETTTTDTTDTTDTTSVQDTNTPNPQKIMSQDAINEIIAGTGIANLGQMTDAQKTISTPQQDLNEAFPDSTPIETPVDTPVDVPQNPADAAAEEAAAAEAAAKEAAGQEATTGGGNETPPEDPNGNKKPPKNPWKTAGKVGLGTAAGGTAIVGAGAMLDNAARNALKDNADPFDVYNTLGGITDQELPDFLSQTPDEIYAQTEADILENLKNQQIGLGESYSDLYAKALQSAYRREASATSPYTNVAGGQPAQTEEALTASAINQFNQIATNYAEQQRDIENMRLAAPQEARAAALEQLSVIQNLTDRNRGEAVQIMTIVTDPQYSNEQRGYLLRQFGLSDEEINQVLNLEQVDNRWLGNIGEWFDQYSKTQIEENGFWAQLADALGVDVGD